MSPSRGSPAAGPSDRRSKDAHHARTALHTHHTPRTPHAPTAAARLQRRNSGSAAPVQFEFKRGGSLCSRCSLLAARWPPADCRLPLAFRVLWLLPIRFALRTSALRSVRWGRGRCGVWGATCDRVRCGVGAPCTMHLAPGGWRLAAGGWRLAAGGGWRVGAAGHCHCLLPAAWDWDWDPDNPNPE
jgi:hypothetical protein